jgi:hypothetical protein
MKVETSPVCSQQLIDTSLKMERSQNRNLDTYLTSNMVLHQLSNINKDILGKKVGKKIHH